MLAGAVHAGKGLFIQQASQSMALRHLFHGLHYDLVMIHSDVRRLIDGSQLMLRGSHLVVLGLCGHAQLPQLYVQILHESADALSDHAEVMILQLLSLGSRRAEQRTAGEDQVGSFQIFLTVNQEILLLRSDGGRHLGRLRIAEQPYNTKRLLAHRLHGTKQRRLLIQRLSRIGAECRRDTEDHARRILLQKCRRCDIPGGIASRLEGCTQTA